MGARETDATTPMAIAASIVRLSTQAMVQW
jgi:hypothetical protein